MISYAWSIVSICWCHCPTSSIDYSSWYFIFFFGSSECYILPKTFWQWLWKLRVKAFNWLVQVQCCKPSTTEISILVYYGAIYLTMFSCLLWQVYQWIGWSIGNSSAEVERGEMKEESTGLIIGISIGVVIGVALAISALFCIRYHRKRSQIGNSSSRRAAAVPIRQNGFDSCTILSDSTLGPESPVRSGRNGTSFWLEGFKKNSNMVSASGIPEYSYK